MYTKHLRFSICWFGLVCVVLVGGSCKQQAKGGRNKETNSSDGGKNVENTYVRSCSASCPCYSIFTGSRLKVGNYNGKTIHFNKYILIIYHAFMMLFLAPCWLKLTKMKTGYICQYKKH
jgi:hypothetical protein